VNSESQSEAEILAFVRATIRSISALELVIYLRGQRQRGFSIGELVRELRSSELAIGQALEQLMRVDLVMGGSESGYRYQQSSKQLDALCQQLETEYARKPVKVIGAILEAPDEKLRIFADAFRLSGKKE